MEKKKKYLFYWERPDWPEESKKYKIEESFYKPWCEVYGPKEKTKPVENEKFNMREKPIVGQQ